MILTYGNICFFAFSIKFGETKQKVITLIAATLKPLLSVPKANGRFSGRKFDTCNVYYSFWNVLAHISPNQHKKGA